MFIGGGRSQRVNLWSGCSALVKLYTWKKESSAFSSYFGASSSLVFWWSLWRSVTNHETFYERPHSEVLFATGLCCVSTNFFCSLRLLHVWIWDNILQIIFWDALASEIKISGKITPFPKVCTCQHTIIHRDVYIPNTILRITGASKMLTICFNQWESSRIWCVDHPDSKVVA